MEAQLSQQVMARNSSETHTNPQKRITTNDSLFNTSKHIVEISILLEPYDNIPAVTTALMKSAFNIVHLRSCEIHRDQLQIKEQLGEGEFGLVYKGAWRGQPCAIKKLKGGITKDSVQYQRLLMELTILAGVGAHPNIVGFFGACINDLGSPLIVEELVDGTNLEEYLDRKSSGFNLGRAKVIRSWTPLESTTVADKSARAGAGLVPGYPAGAGAPPRS